MRYGDYAIGWLPYGKFYLHRKEKRINAKICIYGNYTTLCNCCQASKPCPTKVKKYNPIWALSTTLFNNFSKFYNTIINKLINALILYFYYL